MTCNPLNADWFSLLNMSIADRINEVLSERENLTQAGLARACKRTPSAINQWLKGGQGNMYADNLFRAADYLGVNPRWLVFGKGPKHDAPKNGYGVAEWETADDLPDGRYGLIRRTLVSMAGGDGRAIIEETEGEPLAFSAAWLRERGLRAKDLVIVKVEGDSMEPAINDGDVVLVDMSDTTVRDGKAYALRYGDFCKVKRLHRRYDGGLMVYSDNRDKYPPEEIPPEDLGEHVSVFGRVIWHAGEL